MRKPHAERGGAAGMGGGDGASDALKVPDTWGAVKDPLTPELVTLKKDSAEFRECSSFFMKTLQPNSECFCVPTCAFPCLA